MTAQAVYPYMPIGPSRTSSNGVLWRTRELLISIVGALSVTGTTSGELEDLCAENTVGWEQTNSGVSLGDTTVTSSMVIAELRRRSGLTWDELARLCGVSRRSVHFWASGEKPNAGHQQRLMRLVAAIRYVDRGSAADTHAALTAPLDGGSIPFDLLMHGEFDAVKRQLGMSSRRSAISVFPLSESAKLARMPMQPSDRVGALQDSVHRDIGVTRASRTAKATRGQ